jgi:hypothetical protein
VDVAQADEDARAWSVDAKNYHAWAHRQWALGALAPLLRRGGTPAGASPRGRTGAVPDAAALAWPPALVAHELRVATGALRSDVRNNSGWNHRHFVLAEGAANATATTTTSPPSPAPLPAPPAWLLRVEVDYTLSRLAPRPARNDAAWAYLRAIVRAWVASQPRGAAVPSPASAFPTLLPALAALRAEAAAASVVVTGANELLALLLQLAPPLPPRAPGPLGTGAADGVVSPDMVGGGGGTAGGTAGRQLPSPAALLRENVGADPVRAAFWESEAARVACGGV